MPATDSAADTATVPGLCGPRVYSIAEPQPQNFMTISPPAGDEFTLAWTLRALSTNLVDVGTWTVTLQVTLLNYPAVSATTSVISNAAVNDPCVSMTIPTFASQTALLLDANTTLLVTPTVSQPEFLSCGVSITLTLTKNGVPIADGFVTWTDVVSG